MSMQSRHWGNGERLGVLVVLMAITVALPTVASSAGTEWTAAELSQFNDAFMALFFMLQYLTTAVLANFASSFADEFGVSDRLPTASIYLFGVVGMLSNTIGGAEIITTIGSALALLMVLKAVSPWLGDWIDERFGSVEESDIVESSDYPPEIQSIHEQYFNNEISEKEFERRLEASLE